MRAESLKAAGGAFACCFRVKAKQDHFDQISIKKRSPEVKKKNKHTGAIKDGQHVSLKVPFAWLTGFLIGTKSTRFKTFELK